MKWIRDSHGAFRRPWYDDDEIERIISGKIQAAGTFEVPDRVVDLERFAEQHCKVMLDQYASLPPEVLGSTEFANDGSIRISINRSLTVATERVAPDVSKIGRWRATLAHELGHVILHRILVTDREDQLGLFDQTSDGTLKEVYCGAQTIGPVSLPVGWKEVQANKAMAAMLMPRESFTRYLEHVLKDGGGRSARETIETIARAFRVSRQAAAIRLEELGLVDGAQRLI